MSVTASKDQGLRALLAAREPLTYWSVIEEERAEAQLRRVVSDLGLPLRSWCCLSGLPGVEGSEDLCVALQALLADPREEVVVLRDPDHELSRPAVLRGLRDLAHTGSAQSEGSQARGRSLILLGRSEHAPRALKPEAVHLAQGLPPRAEVLGLLRERLLGLSPEDFPQGTRERLASLAQGLPLRTVRRILDRELEGNPSAERLCETLLCARREAVGEVGVLELVSPLPRLEDIGGLEGLKEWLQERSSLFDAKFVEAGLPVPRGILLMGVSGCGKSLAAKACASLWNLPLYRLDMNLVFSGLHGSHEAAFHRALRAVEAAAPAVLWIDELENGLGTREGGGVVAPEHLFSAFLTWLQEKPPLVFVAATANRIQALPAEVLRKGRFDQVFFLDLPHEDERRAILRIHLERHGIELEDAALDYLVYDTRRWSGAELEQAVISARVRALARGEETTGADLIHAVQSSVPLSRTMHEQIRALREWAFGRAAPASHDPASSEMPS
jgi:ATPase family protein associated with various cellular activities (AAA)